MSDYKKNNIKDKIIKHLIISGKKSKAEKILLNSFKKLQKISNKNSIEILKLSLVNSIPSFKIHRIIKKKGKRKKNRQVTEIPHWIKNSPIKISAAIKSIVNTSRKTPSANFTNTLANDILLSSRNEGEVVNLIKENQKKVLLKKHFLTNFKLR